MKKIQDFSTSISDTSENVHLFVSLSWLVSFGVFIYLYIYIFYFFGVVRNKLQTPNSKQIFTRANLNKIKSSWKEHAMWTCFKFWPMKNIFRKL